MIKYFAELEVFLLKMQKKYNRDMYLKQFLAAKRENTKSKEKAKEESLRKRKDFEIQQEEERIERRNMMEILRKQSYED